MAQDPIPRSRKILIQRLESLQRSGVELIRRIPVAIDAPLTDPARLTPTPAREVMPGPPGTGEPLDQRRRRLAQLCQEVTACTVCRELANSRTQTVFGVGAPNARLCFFGEAPGADEDRQGEPFVGRAGRLLTDIIEKGMGLKREEVYILNTLKCRPPGNRTPTGDEVANCRHFFEAQLEILKPEFICCLGAVAAQALLDTKSSIGKLRGRFHQYRGMRVICTYHPAYLLRNPAAKKDTWQDIQLLMQAMQLPAPKG